MISVAGRFYPSGSIEPGSGCDAAVALPPVGAYLV